MIYLCRWYSPRLTFGREYGVFIMSADCESRITIPLAGVAGPVRQVKGVCGPRRGVGTHGRAGKGMWSEHGSTAVAMVLPG